MDCGGWSRLDDALLLKMRSCYNRVKTSVIQRKQCLQLLYSLRKKLTHYYFCFAVGGDNKNSSSFISILLLLVDAVMLFPHCFPITFGLYVCDVSGLAGVYSTMPWHSKDLCGLSDEVFEKFKSLYVIYLWTKRNYWAVCWLETSWWFLGKVCFILDTLSSFIISSVTFILWTYGSGELSTSNNLRWVTCKWLVTFMYMYELHCFSYEWR